MLTAETARTLLDSLVLLLLGSALVAALVQRLDQSVLVLAAQGGLLAALVVVVGLSGEGAHAYFAALLTFAVKVVAIPAILRQAIGRGRRHREAELAFSPRLVALAAVGLVFVAYYVAAPLGVLGERFTGNALPAAIALLLIGLLVMLTRRQTLSQIIGLVGLENGLYLGAIVATNGLPLAVELGVAVDLLIGVVVMAEVTREINRRLAGGTVDDLNLLRH